MKQILISLFQTLFAIAVLGLAIASLIMFGG